MVASVLGAIGAEFKSCRALRTSPMRSAEMTAASKRLPSRCFLKLPPRPLHDVSPKLLLNHLIKRALTASLNLAFFVTRFPPRCGDVKNSDQLTSSSSSSACDRSLPHSTAKADRWLFGT